MLIVATGTISFYFLTAKKNRSSFLMKVIWMSDEILELIKKKQQMSMIGRMLKKNIRKKMQANKR